MKQKLGDSMVSIASEYSEDEAEEREEEEEEREKQKEEKDGYKMGRGSILKRVSVVADVTEQLKEEDEVKREVNIRRVEKRKRRKRKKEERERRRNERNKAGANGGGGGDGGIDPAQTDRGFLALYSVSIHPTLVSSLHTSSFDIGFSMVESDDHINSENEGRDRKWVGGKGKRREKGKKGKKGKKEKKGNEMNASKMETIPTFELSFSASSSLSFSSPESSPNSSSSSPVSKLSQLKKQRKKEHKSQGDRSKLIEVASLIPPIMYPLSPHLSASFTVGPMLDCPLSDYVYLATQCDEGEGDGRDEDFLRSTNLNHTHNHNDHPDDHSSNEEEEGHGHEHDHIATAAKTKARKRKRDKTKRAKKRRLGKRDPLEGRNRLLIFSLTTGKCVCVLLSGNTFVGKHVRIQGKHFCCHILLLYSSMLNLLLNESASFVMLMSYLTSHTLFVCRRSCQKLPLLRPH